jgi:hypothetical protein
VSSFLLLFPCVVLSHGSCCSGAVNYGQSHKKNETVKPALQTVLHDFLGKDCMAGSVLLYFFIFFGHYPRQVTKKNVYKNSAGSWCCSFGRPRPCECFSPLRFAPPLHVHKKIIQTAGSTCYGNSKFNHFFYVPCLQHVLVRLDFHVIA